MNFCKVWIFQAKRWIKFSLDLFPLPGKWRVTHCDASVSVDVTYSGNNKVGVMDRASTGERRQTILIKKVLLNAAIRTFSVQKTRPDFEIAGLCSSSSSNKVPKFSFQNGNYVRRRKLCLLAYSSSSSPSIFAWLAALLSRRGSNHIHIRRAKAERELLCVPLVKGRKCLLWP